MQKLACIAACALSLCCLGNLCASGQEPIHALGVSECFPDLLKKTTFTHDAWKSNFSLLAIVDKDTYEEAKHNASLTGQFAKLPWSASYEDWNVQRTHLFQSLNVSQDQYRDVITSVSEADPQASQIIDTCLRAQMSNRYGLFYLPTIVDKNTAYIQFFWHPTDRKQNLKIVDSSLKNAEVVGGGTYPGHLFPPKTWYSVPTITGDSITVQLQRSDPNTAITASITTDPQVAVAPLIVKPMPPPANCKMIWDSNSDAGIPLKVERSDTISAVINVPGSGGADSYWQVDLAAPGPVYQLDCHKSANPGYWDIYQPPVLDTNGTSAHCKGRVNGGGGGQVYFAAFYKELRPQCDANPHW